ncbi:MAG: hypothetical protein USCAAHI_00416 [Beijerinckiaceae bacterium]|nr:MAG: hypothetical protein USCAAHI_00416 [Beijerinckiaceae bacterium]
MVIDKPIIELPPTVHLGPRLEADIRRRVRELEGRYPGALTNADRGELQRLCELLRMARSGGGDDPAT